MKNTQLINIARLLAKKFGKSFAARAWPFVSPAVRYALLDSMVLDMARLRDSETSMTIADLLTVREELFDRLMNCGQVKPEEISE